MPLTLFYLCKKRINYSRNVFILKYTAVKRIYRKVKNQDCRNTTNIEIALSNFFSENIHWSVLRSHFKDTARPILIFPKYYSVSERLELGMFFIAWVFSSGVFFHIITECHSISSLLQTKVRSVFKINQSNIESLLPWCLENSPKVSF